MIDYSKLFKIEWCSYITLFYWAQAFSISRNANNRNFSKKIIVPKTIKAINRYLIISTSIKLGYFFSLYYQILKLSLYRMLFLFHLPGLPLPFSKVILKDTVVVIEIMSYCMVLILPFSIKRPIRALKRGNMQAKAN